MLWPLITRQDRRLQCAPAALPHHWGEAVEEGKERPGSFPSHQGVGCFCGTWSCCSQLSALLQALQPAPGFRRKLCWEEAGLCWGYLQRLRALCSHCLVLPGGMGSPASALPAFFRYLLLRVLILVVCFFFSPQAGVYIVS